MDERDSIAVALWFCALVTLSTGAAMLGGVAVGLITAGAVMFVAAVLLSVTGPSTVVVEEPEAEVSDLRQRSRVFAPPKE